MTVVDPGNRFGPSLLLGGRSSRAASATETPTTATPTSTTHRTLPLRVVIVRAEGDALEVDGLVPGRELLAPGAPRLPPLVGRVAAHREKSRDEGRGEHDGGGTLFYR